MDGVEHYLASAERDAATLPELQGIQPRTVQHVAVIGAGTMGSGIAEAFAQAGDDYRVRLTDLTLELATAGRAKIAQRLDSRVAKGKMTRAAAELVLAVEEVISTLEKTSASD